MCLLHASDVAFQRGFCRKRLGCHRDALAVYRVQVDCRPARQYPLIVVLTFFFLVAMAFVTALPHMAEAFEKIAVARGMRPREAVRTQGTLLPACVV